MNEKPKKGEYLDILLRSPKTVFSTKDVVLLWLESRENKVSGRLNKYVKSDKLVRIRRGIYAKDKNYNRFEMATRIYTPSYISFETVLTRAGINFQFYKSIFVASYVTREIKVEDQTIYFIRIKDYVLSDTTGIENHPDGYSIATKERAVLDRIYVTKDYHFDNLSGLDWNKIFEILPIYKNKSMDKSVKKYFNHYNDNGLSKT